MAVFATFTPQCRWIFVQITTVKLKKTGKNRPEWDTNRADQTTGPFQNKTSSYLPLWRPQGSRGGCARHPRTPPHPVSCPGNVCERACCRWKPKRLLKSWESNYDLIQTRTDPQPGSGSRRSEHERHEDVDAAPARGFSALWVFLFFFNF